MLIAVRQLFSVTHFQFRENGKVVGEMERSIQKPLRGVRGRAAGWDHESGVDHGSCKDRPSVGLDGGRSGIPFLALLADMEAAAGLDDPDYLGEAALWANPGMILLSKRG